MSPSYVPGSETAFKKNKKLFFLQLCFTSLAALPENNKHNQRSKTPCCCIPTVKQCWLTGGRAGEDLKEKPWGVPEVWMQKDGGGGILKDLEEAFEMCPPPPGSGR